MYARLLTFREAEDIDAGVDYLREVLPILEAQHGYRGVSASADREGQVLSMLSLWDSEADRSASDSALGKARQECLEIVRGELSVENFEQVTEAITRPPVPGCSLIAIRYRMDPDALEGNLAFFHDELLPLITARSGFCALRNMLDRLSGRGIIGSVFDDREAMEGGLAGVRERRPIAESRGITYDQVSCREVLVAHLT
jgi:hypothetical protein